MSWLFCSFLIMNVLYMPVWKNKVYIWKQTWVPWFLFINTICMTVQWYIYFNTKWFTIMYIDKVLTAVLPVVILWIGQEIQLRISAWVLINWLIWPPVWKEKHLLFHTISTEQNDNYSDYYPHQHMITSRLLQAYAAVFVICRFKCLSSLKVRRILTDCQNVFLIYQQETNCVFKCCYSKMHNICTEVKYTS